MKTIQNIDCIAGLKKIQSNSIDCVLIDPPYNIKKDFGNNKDNLPLKEYVEWSKKWISESVRVLKDTGTIYIYGFSEILAHVSVNIPLEHRWLIWHYKNKTTPSLQFWQRSHESIIVAWKEDRIFNRDDVREPYTETFLKNAAGKVRKNTKGRFGKKEGTVYTAHKNGALPRDVIEVSALAGGAGLKERFFYCKDCKESYFNIDLKEHEEHEIIQHPTQKPSKLTERLLMACMPKGGTVLIPFVGSGAEILVAKKLGMNYIGFDINNDYVLMAESILKKAG